MLTIHELGKFSHLLSNFAANIFFKLSNNSWKKLDVYNNNNNFIASYMLTYINQELKI